MAKIPRMVTPNWKFDWLYSEEAKKYNHIVYMSGRGAGKSWSVADYLLWESMNNPVFSVVLRNTKISIGTSVWKTFEDRMYALGIRDQFTKTQNDIRHIGNDSIKGTNALIALFGSDAHPEDFKSIPNIDFLMWEESNKIPRHPWDVILPTSYRGGGFYKKTRNLILFNPEYYTDEVYKRFVLPFIEPVDPRTGRRRYPVFNTKIFETHWTENSLRVPGEMEAAAYNDYLRDPDYAAWAWDGQLKRQSEEIVFKHGIHWEEQNLDQFITKDMDCYIGADFGTNSPTCAVVAWMSPDESSIYISHECYQADIGVDEIPDLFNQIELIRNGNLIRGDCAADWAIRALRKRGFNIIPCNKGGSRGSIYPGIQWLRGKKIYVHPSCVNMIFELSNYKFAKNAQQELKMDTFEDKHNHLIDSLRYAMEPFIMIKRSNIADQKVLNLDFGLLKGSQNVRRIIN